MQLVNSEHSNDSGSDAGQDPGQESEHSENESGSGGQDPGQESEHSTDPVPEVDPAVESLRNEVKALRAELQKKNITEMHVPDLPSSADTEKILAGIIRPPFDEPDKK